MATTWIEFIDTEVVKSAKKKADDRLSLLKQLGLREEPTDLVFQGGGMLGVAHLGALYALELLNVTPRKVAGTSAGAIFATLLAAHMRSKPATESHSLSERMYLELMGMPASSFLDGNRSSRRLTNMLLATRRTFGDYWKTGLSLFDVISVFKRRLGVHRGTAFSLWLDGRLAELGFTTAASIGKLQDQLKVVACAVPGGIKIVLPDDLRLFDIAPSTFPPSIFARASMAVPLIFDPVRLPLNRNEWINYCNVKLAKTFSASSLRELTELRSVLLFDGGLFSNLPTDLLPNSGDDKTLTIALALYTHREVFKDPERARGLRQSFAYLMQLANAARMMRDREARELGRTSNLRVIWIDVDDANWLDFRSNIATARKLFECGMKAVLGG